MKRVPLSNGAAATLAELSKYHGHPERDILESLLHFAASQMERPGSWEAQGFDLQNYVGADPLADRWFNDERTFTDALR